MINEPTACASRALRWRRIDKLIALCKAIRKYRSDVRHGAAVTRSGKMKKEAGWSMNTDDARYANQRDGAPGPSTWPLSAGNNDRAEQLAGVCARKLPDRLLLAGESGGGQDIIKR
ncbi:hypothetical protein LAD77_00205 [Klebsiella pneumoniae]|nr:hypothetical protein [Klebsiella pneumoniae]